jgi:hypothetical protein
VLAVVALKEGAMNARPWKVVVTLAEGARSFTRSFGSGERAFDEADGLRSTAHSLRVKNVMTGEVWSWDEGSRPQTLDS